MVTRNDPPNSCISYSKLQSLQFPRAPHLKEPSVGRVLELFPQYRAALMAKVELFPATTPFQRTWPHSQGPLFLRDPSSHLFPSGLCPPWARFPSLLLTSSCLFSSSSHFFWLVLKSVFINMETSGLFLFCSLSWTSCVSLGKHCLLWVPVSLCVVKKGRSDRTELYSKGVQPKICFTHWAFLVVHTQDWAWVNCLGLKKDFPLLSSRALPTPPPCEAAAELGWGVLSLCSFLFMVCMTGALCFFPDMTSNCQQTGLRPKPGSTWPTFQSLWTSEGFSAGWAPATPPTPASVLLFHGLRVEADKEIDHLPALYRRRK